MPDGSSTAHLYRPKLATVLMEGYTAQSFQRDIVAALTVAIVALPLSMAIAVASGVSPDRGLYTSIIGGFLVSALGGSRFQIGGPAGAFIVLVSATAAQFGIEGLVLAVALSGIMLMTIGALRLGSLIRYIPHAVTVGFTCGIALTIFAGQIRDLAGLRLPGAEPGPFLPKIAALFSALPTLSPATFAIGAGTAAIIFVFRRFQPTWPGMLIAVACASVAAVLLPVSIETIGSRFGGIPAGLPRPQLPN
jgi:SulP family sulfate permease